MRTRALASVSSVFVLAAVLAGCATPSGGTIPGGSPDAPASAAPPSGTVMAQGTVMDVEGDVELCLGAIAESYPPQCSGIPLAGWSWDGVEGSETRGDVTWGAYALEGTYDGTTFTLSGTPIMLALYDPMPLPDPTDGATGASDEAALVAIQDDLPGALGDDGSLYLGSYPERGYLWIDVVWDDGTLQEQLDAEYGDDVVVVRSAIRAV